MPRPDFDPQGPHDHEAVFERHYRRLTDYARSLGASADEVSDVVNEAYVLFVTARPRLDGITNVEGYLAVVVRNVYLSERRRSARFPKEPLNLLDYDTAEFGLRDMHPMARMETHESLIRICRYGLRRRRSSKAGSVLLFRYFLGYHPYEVALLMRGRTRGVDDLLIEARREARELIDARAGMAWPLEEAQLAIEAPRDDGQKRDFLQTLKAWIFAHAHHNCFSRRQLQRIYAVSEGSPVDATTLAELVTCAACLDAACAILGIDREDERYPTDMLGPSGRGTGNKPGRPPASGRRRGSSLSRRVTDLLEHRPRTLQVAVNGFTLGSHRIGAETVDHTLNLMLDAPLAFVETFSEQGVRLAMLSVEPPPAGSIQQGCQVNFPDGRALELSVDLSGREPLLRLLYEPVGTVVRAEGAPVASPDTGETSEIKPHEQRPRQSWWSAWRPSWPAMPTNRALVAVTGLVVVLVLVLVPDVRAAVRELAAWIRLVAAEALMPAEANPVPPPAPPLRVAPPAALLPELPLPPPPPIPSRSDLFALEADALWRLHLVGALVGEDIVVERTADEVRVWARVDGASRRAQLEEALAPVVSAPGGRVRIRAFPIAGSRVAAVPTEVNTHDIISDRTAASGVLGRHFAREFGNEADPRVREAERAFAAQMLSGSRQVVLHAFALQRIVAASTAADVPRPPARAMNTLQVLVREYAGRIESGADNVRRDLLRVVGGAAPEVSSSHAPRGRGTSPPDVSEVVTLTGQLDELVRQTFAIATGTGGSSTFDADRLLFLATAIRDRAAVLHHQSGGIQ